MLSYTKMSQVVRFPDVPQGSRAATRAHSYSGSDVRGLPSTLVLGISVESRRAQVPSAPGCHGPRGAAAVGRIRASCQWVLNPSESSFHAVGRAGGR
jgi:hypothetical protein